MKPEPRRIEEPILWLFKQFGFIRSNTKVLRPYPIKQPDKEVWKPGFLGIGGKYVRVEGELARYEEEKSAKPSSGKEGDNHEVFSGQLRKTG